jgi:hypothetical protein
VESGQLHVLTTLPPERAPRCPLSRGLGGFRGRYGGFGEEKDILLMSEVEAFRGGTAKMAEMFTKGVVYLGKILSILLLKILRWLSLDRPFSIFGVREEQTILKWYYLSY